MHIYTFNMEKKNTMQQRQKMHSKYALILSGIQEQIKKLVFVVFLFYTGIETRKFISFCRRHYICF